MKTPLGVGSLQSPLLGTMPDSVRVVVQRLIAEARSGRVDVDERLNGFLLSGGPGGASYLDADGEVWNCYWDVDGSGEMIERVPDGPIKVGLIAIAAERVPELAAWLPKRPEEAQTCDMCGGKGSSPPETPIQCARCFGLGWVEG